MRSCPVVLNREALKALQVANQMFHRDADATDGLIFFLLL